MSDLRLVLAEADLQHRDALLMMLADGRPTPRICVEKSGAHLLRTLRQCTVDAVIISDCLPDYDVSALIAAVAPNLLACPVIVIAHRPDQAAAVQCFRSGVSDFIPISEALSPGVLWQTVMRAVVSFRRRASERRSTERRQSMLQRAADTDPMTGLFNRRYFQNCYENHHWAGDRRQYLAVNLIDVDHFKQVNDQYGHGAGDQVLREVAREIRRHCQPADLPFRWGGDEFLVLRYAGDMCESWIWAERLRVRIEQLRTQYLDRSIPVSLSIGLSLVPSRHFSEACIEGTDQALYQAKNCGRNHVCTEEMTRAIAAADRITRCAGLDIEQRRVELLRGERERLGPTQRQHVTQHSQAVGQICWLLGRAAQLPDELSLHLRRIGLLHSMGKIVVPETLLGKTSPLTADEWMILSHAPTCSALLAEHLQAPEQVTAALKLLAAADKSAPADPELRTLCHITRVANALASMLAGRVYRPAMTFRDALTELNCQRGKMFDPDVVNLAHFISPPQITRLPVAA